MSEVCLHVRIKTNMYIQQKTGLIDKPSKAGATEKHQLCMVTSGAGGCAAQLSGGNKIDTNCVIAPDYSLIRPNGDVVMESVPLHAISKNCIDLNDPSMPVITKDKCTLGPGRYFLVASLEGKTKKISFKVNGELDIATRDAIAIDSNGTALPGQTYAFKKDAMGGELVPLYISAIADPCQNNAACSQPLEMDVTSAPNQNYTLEPDPGLTVYVRNAAGELEPFPSSASRTIGASGVDTVYVTAALIGMTQSPTTYSIGVTLLYGPLLMLSLVGFQNPSAFLRASPSRSSSSSESFSFPSGTFGKMRFCTGAMSSPTSIASRMAKSALWYQRL